MKKPVLIGVVLFVLLLGAGAGYWVWQLGSMIPEPISALELRVSHGPVDLKRQGESDWKPIDGKAEVHQGDEIRSGAEGRAEIQWGDLGVTRIDPSTELTLESEPSDVRVRTNVTLRLKLTAGSVWTRLMKLLDVSSTAEVAVGNVVATVRGTAFGVGVMNQGMDVAVGDSVVAVGAKDAGDRILVREGRWGHFSATGTPEIVRDLNPGDAWAKDNTKKDAELDAESRKAFEARLTQRIPVAPEWLVGLSERLHLTMARGADADTLNTDYARRRLARALLRPEQADRAMAEIERFRPNPEDLLSDIRLGLMHEHTAPDRRVRDALQRLRRALLSKTPEGLRYALALDMDDHIDDLIFPVLPMERDDQMTLRDLLQKDVDEWQKGNDGMTDEMRRIFTSKAAAMRERLAGIDTSDSDDVVSSTAETATSTSAVVTSTVLGAPPVAGATVPGSGKTATTTATPAACVYQRVTIFAKPMVEVHVNDAVALSLFATCADGKTDDVTTRAAFTPTSAKDGTVTGSTFVPAHEGMIGLQGTLQDNGHALSAYVQISVLKNTRRLSGLQVSAIGPTALTTGQSVPVQAIASYSDGGKLDVSSQCVWSTSDAQKGLVSNLRFQSLSGVGTVSAICTYKEGGVTLMGSVLFTISLDPALYSSGGSTPKSKNAAGGLLIGP